eukprot:scaffold12.g8060.t1
MLASTLARPLASLATLRAAPYSTMASEWLARFTNYEQRGVPAAAGTNTAEGFDLGRMHRLLAALGDPHHRWPAVHVAGTKGKGSTPHVAAFNERLAIDGAPIPDAALDDLVARHAPAVEAAQRTEDGALSHFEVATALAFAHFAERAVDVAVVEVGLGGVRDATNVLPPGGLLAAVLTAVGSDHAAALGGGIEQIAAAKAGIMKAGRPAVVARQPEPEAERVLLRKGTELGCDLVLAQQEVQLCSLGMVTTPEGSIRRDDCALLRPPLLLRIALARLVPCSPRLTAARCAPCPSAPRRQRCRLQLVGQRSLAALAPPPPAAAAESSGSSSPQSPGCEAELRLVGGHQLDNAATAVAAAAVLRERGFDRLSLPAVAAGLAAATLPGRFQLCRFADEAPGAVSGGAAAAAGPAGGAGAAGLAVVLDGAHTPESAAALAAALRAAFPAAPLALVLAMAEDKAHREVCAPLRGLEPGVVVFTQVAIAGGAARAAAPGQLAAAWQAAAILGGGRRRGGVRTRELIQASLPAAVEAARRELRARVATDGGGGGGAGPTGVVVVCGSLHAAGAALRQLDLLPG